MLCLCARIEAHNEVVSGVMGRGVESERLREQECAPIGDATYDTEAGEDQGAGCACDSEREGLVREMGKSGVVVVVERAYSFTSASFPGRSWELSVTSIRKE